MGKRHRFSVVAFREVTFGGKGWSSRMTRRDFIVGATLVFVAPAAHLLPSQQPSSAASQSRVVFTIRGWSGQDDRAGANQVWITVSNSWRTAWR
jgi:hypothetical protein